MGRLEKRITNSHLVISLCMAFAFITMLFCWEFEKLELSDIEFWIFAYRKPHKASSIAAVPSHILGTNSKNKVLLTPVSTIGRGFWSFGVLIEINGV